MSSVLWGVLIASGRTTGVVSLLLFSLACVTGDGRCCLWETGVFSGGESLDRRSDRRGFFDSVSASGREPCARHHDTSVMAFSLGAPAGKNSPWASSIDSSPWKAASLATVARARRPQQPQEAIRNDRSLERVKPE